MTSFKIVIAKLGNKGLKQSLILASGLSLLFLHTTFSMNDFLKVYALPEDYRIFPHENAAIEAPSSKLNDLKKKNSIWNTSAKAISLSSPRNQTIAFQLIFETKSPAEDIRLEFTDLKGSSGKISRRNINPFFVGYVPEAKSYYPDILVPFDVKGVHPFSIPHQVEALATVSNQISQTVWIDIEVPEDAKAGSYQGEIAIEANGEKFNKLTLKLNVLDITIPMKRNFHFIMDSYGSFSKFLKNSKQDDNFSFEEKIYQLAHDHRTTTDPIPYSQNGVARPDALPEFERDKNGKLKVNWSKWDRRYAKYFDGSAFKDKQPIEQFCLYFNIFWPALQWPEKHHIYPDFKSDKKAEYEAIWKEYAEAFAEHFKREEWKDTLFTIKMNHYKRHLVPKGIPLAWEADTPSQKEDFESVAYYADLVHRSFKDAKPAQVFFRMDTDHSFCKDAGCSFENFDKHQAQEIMKNVDHWYFEWQHALAHIDQIKEIKKKGKSCFFYKHGLTPNHGSPEFKSLGWILWSGHLDGYCMWNKVHMDLKVRRAPEDPDEYAWENYVMYAGEALNYDGVFPSIRLKLWRSALYDAELLKMAAVKNPKSVQSLADRMVKFQKTEGPTTPDKLKPPVIYKDPEEYFQVRDSLYSLLEK